MAKGSRAARPTCADRRAVDALPLVAVYVFPGHVEAHLLVDRCVVAFVVMHAAPINVVTSDDDNRLLDSSPTYQSRLLVREIHQLHTSSRSCCTPAFEILSSIQQLVKMLL